MQGCMRLCKFPFTIISSLPCLHIFWHAIPTSFYIFNVEVVITALMTEYCTVIGHAMYRAAQQTAVKEVTRPLPPLAKQGVAMQDYNHALQKRWRESNERIPLFVHVFIQCSKTQQQSYALKFTNFFMCHGEHDPALWLQAGKLELAVIMHVTKAPSRMYEE